MNNLSLWKKYFTHVFLYPLILFWAVIILEAFYIQQKQYEAETVLFLKELNFKLNLIKKNLPENVSDKKSLEKLCGSFEKLCGANITIVYDVGLTAYGSRDNLYPVELAMGNPGAVYEEKDGQVLLLLPSQHFGYAKTSFAPGLEMHMKVPYDNTVSSALNIPSVLLVSGLVFSFLLALVSILISKSFSVPVEETERCLKELEKDNYAVRYSPDTPFYPSSISRTMDDFADSLKEKVMEMREHNNQLSEIWASMTQSFIAINTEGDILNMNNAAIALFSITQNFSGRPLAEAARNLELNKFAERLLKERCTIESELTFYNGSERYLQLKGSILHDLEGKTIGGLIAITDLTQLRKLEKLRHDFVANVSHEIRTPITAIKAAIETLLSGASENPEEAQRFMKVIVKHSDRLNALVEDILSLSSIEREAGKDDYTFWEVPVAEVINTASELCREKAEAKKIKLNISCRPDIKAELDRQLFEQAIVNLIDNAIKYSNDNSEIDVNAVTEKNFVKISVRDCGCGIPREHLPRIFERFYRVDKARSRKLGGTGLGLAIVKHIAQLHKGTVSVDSQVGHGSVFTISIPCSQTKNCEQAPHISA